MQAEVRSLGIFFHEHWSLEASLLPEGEEKTDHSNLLDKGGEKFEISEEQMNQALAELKGKEFKVCDMKKGRAHKKSAASFYNQYFAAGSFQSAEFPDLEDDADCTAAV